MLPKHRLPTPPGEMLLEDFLKPAGITQRAFAKHLGVPLQMINEIIHNRRSISFKTAFLMAQALGTTPEFWLNLQTSYEVATVKKGRKVKCIFQPSESRKAAMV